MEKSFEHLRFFSNYLLNFGNTSYHGFTENGIYIETLKAPDVIWGKFDIKDDFLFIKHISLSQGNTIFTVLKKVSKYSTNDSGFYSSDFKKWSIELNYKLLNEKVSFQNILINGGNLKKFWTRKRWWLEKKIGKRKKSEYFFLSFFNSTIYLFDYFIVLHLNVI